MSGGRRFTRSRRRTIAVLAAVAVVAVGGCTGENTSTGTGPASGRSAGTTAVTFTGVTSSGGPTSADQLQRAAAVLRSRLAAQDIGPATVDVTGNTIVVTAPTADTDQVKASGAPAVLRLRPVRAGPFPAPSPAASGPGQPAGDYPGVMGADAAALAALDCTRPATADQPGQALAACGQDGSQKLLLEPVIIDGTGIKNATTQFSSNAGGWTITIEFTSTAQATFADYTGTHNATITPNDPHTQLAFVLDGRVISAPQVQDRITGPTEITGNFSQTTASTLAAAVSSGALPIRLLIRTVHTN
jgi:preprotein translocase subunit SecD